MRTDPKDPMWTKRIGPRRATTEKTTRWQGGDLRNATRGEACQAADKFTARQRSKRLRMADKLTISLRATDETIAKYKPVVKPSTDQFTLEAKSSRRPEGKR